MNSVASMNKKRRVDEMESDQQNEMRPVKIQKIELEQRKFRMNLLRNVCYD